MEHTHEAILEGAGRTFSRFGFAKTSMDDIAREAHVAKGTLYLYCQSKQDLFSQSIERELRRWIDDLSSLIDPARSAVDILVEMGHADAAFVEQRPMLADLLSGVLDHALPAEAERFDALRAVARKHVVAVLELGISQQVFAPDLDVAATARVLQDMQLAGALLHHRTSLPLRQVRRQQAAALRLVLGGLQRR